MHIPAHTACTHVRKYIKYPSCNSIITNMHMSVYTAIIDAVENFDWLNHELITTYASNALIYQKADNVAYSYVASQRLMFTTKICWKAPINAFCSMVKVEPKLLPVQLLLLATGNWNQN